MSGLQVELAGSVQPTYRVRKGNNGELVRRLLKERGWVKHRTTKSPDSLPNFVWT
jgi:hypothetical protein